MPTDDELRTVANTSMVKTGEEETAKRLTPSLIQKMRAEVPGMNYVYGLTKHYNPTITDIIFVSLSPDQLDVLCEGIANTPPKTKDLRTEYGLKMLVMGVQKSEDERLSEVTDAKKIILGGG